MISGKSWVSINMLKLKYTKQFRKDIKKFEHQKNVMTTLKQVIERLIEGKSLQEKYRDHFLGGNWVSFRECHIKPDVLLIYKVINNELFLERIGSHSDLF